MRLTILLFFIAMSPQLLLAESLMCSELFKSFGQAPLLTEYRLENADASVVKILRRVNRVFIEYPRGYMENSRATASITVPESRWLEVFGQDYLSVIKQLSKVEIHKIETYEDGSQSRAFDRNLLISFRNDQLKHFPNEWVEAQRSYSFQFDRRILTLMEWHREPAHVAIILEHGTIEKIPPLIAY